MEANFLKQRADLFVHKDRKGRTRDPLYRKSLETLEKSKGWLKF